jgi:hypothetical protein
MTTNIHINDQEKPSSNTDNSIDMVLDMNARGVYLLQNNRFSDALTVFREALAELRSEILASSEVTQAFPSCSEQSQGTLESTLVSFPGILCPVDRSINKIEQIDSYLLFARPLGLGSGGSSIIDDDLLSGILLFNTGLTRHLQGSKSGKANIVLQALELYKIAFSIFASCETADTSLASMAIINNRGHAFLLLGSNQEAQECREDLVVCLREAHRNCLTDEEQVRRVNAYILLHCFCLPPLIKSGQLFFS